MEVAIVLEDQTDDFVQLDRIIHTINTKAVILRFKTVIEFANWFSQFVQEPPEENYQVMLMVSDFRILGANHISLFQKINTFMAKMGFLPEGKTRIPLLISARDVEGFDSRLFQHPIFDNIVFKPFDASVCRGKIDWALFGTEAIQKEELQKQKPVSPLEMLKDIEIDNVTEIGFRTVGLKRIEVGKLAKYYIESLKSLGDDYGLYATCTHVTEIPGPTPQYTCLFSYFGLDRERARKIRLIIGEAKGTVPAQTQMKAPPTGAKSGVVLIGQSKEQAKRLESALDASFKNLDVVSFPNFTDFYTEIDAEKASKSWLEQFGKITPAILEFDQGTELFIKAFRKGEKSGAQLSDYLGMTVEHLKRFKTLCLSNCLPDQRKTISQFWAQDVKSPQTVILRDGGSTFFVTLVAGQLVDGKVGESKKRQIEIRPSEPREVQAYLKGQSRLPGDLRLVIMTDKIAKLREKDFWKELRTKLNPRRAKEPAPIIVLSDTRLNLYEQAREAECFTDFMIEPFDQAFLKKKIKYLLPDLELREEEKPLMALPGKEKAKVGVQVNVQNFSEISISVEYHRDLPTDCYRDFIIYIKKEREYLRLLAKHMASQRDEKDTSVIVNHFTFFGLGDRTNQKIRQWLNEQYSLSKQEKE